MSFVRSKIKASVIASVGTFLIFVLLYPREITENKIAQEKLVQTEFNWFKQEIDVLLTQLSDYFERNETLSLSCLERDLSIFRRAHFQMPMVAEFGLVNPQGELICASWGKVVPPRLTASPKPINPGQMRFFGPIHTTLVGEAALVISRTRKDGYELNALLPQSILQSRIAGVNEEFTFAAIIDAKTGVPLSIVGNYSLPINSNSLFPIDSSVTLKQQQLDNLTTHFLIAEPLAQLPELAFILAIDDNVLYGKKVLPSITTLIILIVSFAGLFLLVTSYQEIYKSRKSKLIHAMQTGQFVNFYQLIWDSNQQKYVGAETLARQIHPVEGLLTPNRFLPDIEKNGLSVELTLAVIRNLTLESATLLNRHKDLKININITGAHFKCAEFLKEIAILKRSIPRLVLELTETELVELDDARVVDAIQYLKSLGIKLAIDDFGTGYAGIQYLKQLPFDILKIDQSFVSSIGTQSQLRKILDGLIELAKNLDLEIVAEGVETEEQAQYLIKNGVTLHQGWLYHKATSLNSLVS